MIYSDKNVDTKVRAVRQLLFDAQEPHNLTTKDFVEKLDAAKRLLEDACFQADYQLRRERRQVRRERQQAAS